MKLLAEWTGLEPATPCVTGTYSNQLNYHSVWDCKYTNLILLHKAFLKKLIINYSAPFIAVKESFLL